MAAVKLTFDTLAKLHYIFINVNFENYDWLKNGWSIEIGITMMVINFFMWTSIGILIDLCFNLLGRCLFSKTRTVRFENTNEGVIQISALRERGKKASPFYELTLEKSKISCILGADINQKTKLLEMIAGERACDNGGSMVIKDSDFFARGNKPKLSEYLTYRSSELSLDGSLKAIDHLNLIAHLRGN